MKFYYENTMGDNGTFEESNIVKAIYTAWNIEANLYLDNELIFSPKEDNKFNSELLCPYGYKMIDAEEYREIVEITTGKIVKYGWPGVKQLV